MLGSLYLGLTGPRQSGAAEIPSRRGRITRSQPAVSRWATLKLRRTVGLTDAPSATELHFPCNSGGLTFRERRFQRDRVARAEPMSDLSRVSKLRVTRPVAKCSRACALPHSGSRGRLTRIPNKRAARDRRRGCGVWEEGGGSDVNRGERASSSRLT